MAKEKHYMALAKYYDLIYSWKDYKKEAGIIHRLIQKHKKTKGKEVLEVACGSGNHIQYLKGSYTVTGIDINQGILSIAKKKFPKIRFVKANMISFNLRKQFDVVLCLFSSIGYVKTYKNLEKTIACFSKHVKQGGVVIIEPFISPKNYKTGNISANIVDKPDVKIARMNQSKRKGNISILDFHFLITTKEKGVQYFRDKHELGLFEEKKVVAIMKKKGFDARYLKNGLMKDRGLYIGIKK